MEYIIGVDGGGTKTKALLAKTTGEIIGSTQAGPSNYQQVGQEGLKEICTEILQAFEKNHDIKKDEIAYWVLGLAGAGRQKEQTEATQAVASLGFPGKVEVTSDAYIALMGAFEGRPGIIIIAGTGSICFGLDENGQLYRSGGWGYLLGDEGSGYYIGHQGLLAAVKDYDGRGEPTILRPRIESFLDLASMDQIIYKIYGIDGTQPLGKEDIAALAPIVFACAGDGDRVAQNIIRQAAIELAIMIHAVGKKLKKIEEPIEVATIGSIFKQKAMLLPEMQHYLKKHFSEIDIHEPVFDPAVGALIVALKRLGQHITLNVLENLRTTYEVA